MNIQRNQMLVRLPGLALLASVALIAACGTSDNSATVSGTVMIDGQPAEKGSIAFMPVDGNGPSAGAAIVAGKYTASVWPGKSKVEIRVPKVIGTEKLYDTPDSPVQDVMAEVLPPRYNEKTELEIEVAPGQNPKDWDLTTKTK